MNKSIFLLPLLFVLIASFSYAAVTGCINAYTYNDSVTGHNNVTAGKVCINDTAYNVSPTLGVNCDEWYAYVDGACGVTTWWTGYTGDGTNTCVDTEWVSTNTSDSGIAFLPLGYIVNQTINSAPNGLYSTNVGEVVPAKNACANAYTFMGPTGYCDGGGVLDTNSSTAYVPAGKICTGAALNVSANSTLSCGTWYECVLGASTYSTYYTGYSGSGSACSATGWTATGSTYTMPAGFTVGFTSNSATVCTDNSASTAANAVAGITNAKILAYAGFGLLALMLLVIAAYAVVQVFKGGSTDLMTVSITIIGGAVVVIVAFIIIYFVSKALGA